MADSPLLQHQMPEPYSELLVALARGAAFTHILAPAGTFGKNLLPRAAALLDCQPAADVVGIVDADTFVRPVYAGNAMATVRFATPGLRMLTVRPGAGASSWGVGAGVGGLMRVAMGVALFAVSSCGRIPPLLMPPPPHTPHAVCQARPTSFKAATDAAASPAPVELVPADALAALAGAPPTPTWVGETGREAGGRPDLGSAKVGRRLQEQRRPEAAGWLRLLSGSLSPLTLQQKPRHSPHRPPQPPGRI